MPSSGSSATHYDPRAAEGLASSLKRAATVINDQASRRANLRVTLLSDCWTGQAHDQGYEPSYASQMNQAAELHSRLLTLAHTVEAVSAQMMQQASAAQAAATAAAAAQAAAIRAEAAQLNAAKAAVGQAAAAQAAAAQASAQAAAARVAAERAAAAAARYGNRY